MQPQHNSLQSHQLHPIPVIVQSWGSLLEEIKHQSLCTKAEVPPYPSEAEEKDLLESERLKVVAS
jgi:hypothetical protein